MIFEQIPISGDRNFAYLIGDEATREGALIDPGSDPDLLAQRVREHGLRLACVIHTHGHPDHTGASEAVRRATGAKLAAYGKGDRSLRHDDRLAVGNLEVQILHTPGHTEDSICVLAAGKLMTGDTLFVGKIGGTAGEAAARTEYGSLHDRICALPPETEVWPGHDYGVRPSSTVGEEIRTNPFLLRDSFESFFELKQNWAEYKQIHGIQ